MSGLAIAKDLTLPVDAVTQKTAFLGRTGSGKTYGATKLAELMLDANAQVVALDPVGVWYGLRLDKNGKDIGIEIPIFGGLHGDIPLAPTGGALLADLIVDRRLSAILDVSQLETDADKARFAGDFANRFFFRKKASPSAVHLFIEECQEFVPQNPGRGEEHMLHYFHRLIKLGRNFGIGVSLISQRPQEVNKKALNQTECMFAFQMTGPQERKAISLWVSEKGADEDVADVLPKLGIGEPHVWSPQWLGISRTIKVAAKRTFNASSTPTVGSVVVEAKPLGAIDLEKLQKAMASTIEKAKETDPKFLRAEIARLKKDLEAKPKTNGHSPAKPVIDQAAIDRAVTLAVKNERKRWTPALVRIQRDITGVSGTAQKLAEGLRLVSASLSTTLEEELQSEPTHVTIVPPPSGPVLQRGPRFPSSQRTPVPAEQIISEGLSRPQQEILDAIAALNLMGIEQPSRGNVGVWLGKSSEAGGFKNDLGRLRTEGLIQYPTPGTLELTDKGVAAANADAQATTLEDLHKRWFSRLSGPQTQLLRVLVGVYPGNISRPALGATVSKSHDAGGFKNDLGRLRSLGLIDYPTPGEVIATELLFPEGLA